MYSPYADFAYGGTFYVPQLQLLEYLIFKAFVYVLRKEKHFRLDRIKAKENAAILENWLICGRPVIYMILEL